MKNRTNLQLTARPAMILSTILLVIFSLSSLVLAAPSSAIAEDGPLVKIAAYLSVSEVAPGETVPGVVVVEIADQWHINSAKPLESYLIPAEIEINNLESISVSNILTPKGHNVELIGEMMSVYDGEVFFYFDITLDAAANDGSLTIPIEFSYQACNNKECRAPQTLTTDLKISVGSAGEAVNAGLFGPTETIATAATESILPETEPTELELLINKYGFWGYFMALGLAFVTGLLLSFSPCTYPMIPITVSIFAGQQRSIAKGFTLSLIYVSSMAFVYGLMGLVVSLVGGVFGAWLADPAVVIGIAIVFVIFSLSMFGVYDLNVPAALRNKMGNAKGDSGVVGVMILGVVAALVVSPCVGPFVAGILLYVATYGSPVFGFAVLFIFALGLGTLYILIGTFSSAINALPNSGEWMETVKKFFGFVLLVMAVYFLRTVISPMTTALLSGLLLVGFGVFGGGLDRLTSESAFFDRLKKFLGLLAMLVGLYLLVGSLLINGMILPPASDWLPVASGSAKTEKAELIDWETELEAGLAAALADGKPVLIDTWATWCANCKVLDRTVFADSRIGDEAKRFVPLKIQLEKSSTATSQAFMKRFGMKHYSLPTTLILDSKGKVTKLFQGVMTADELLVEMKKVK